MPGTALSEDLQKLAVSDDPSARKQVMLLRDWAKFQPHLKIRPDDRWLLNFLRACKVDVQLAKEKLDMRCAVKTLMPEFFASRDPFLPEIQKLLKLGFCLPLRETEGPGDPRVIIFRTQPMFVDKTIIESGIKLGLMMLDILLNEDDNFVTAGSSLIIDAREISIEDSAQGPGIARKFYNILKKAYPLRLPELRIINLPPVLVNMYKKYSKRLLATSNLPHQEELLQMIHVYGNTDEEKSKLYKEVPLSILPQEYGGKGESVQNLTEYWKQKVETYKNWFAEDAAYCSDESKRPGGPKTVEDVMDMDISVDTSLIDTISNFLDSMDYETAENFSVSRDLFESIKSVDIKQAVRDLGVEEQKASKSNGAKAGETSKNKKEVTLPQETLDLFKNSDLNSLIQSFGMGMLRK